MPRDAPTRQQVCDSTSVPAPIGGWNARDSLASMPPTDAVYLDNWFPRQDRVEVRAGFADYCSLTGIAGDVETLAPWNGGSASKLVALATTGAAIRAFDCSSSGVKAADAGFTALAHTGASAQYSSVMFNNIGGYFLYFCDENAVNAPAYWDGTNWTAPALTGSGLTPSNLCQVALYKFRLIFVEKGTLNFWYLPQDALAGAAQKFRLGGLCNEGGFLMATGTWTVDAGEGTDDRFVCVTSRGQVVVFTGDDPGAATAWDHMGTYKTAPPIGRKCLFRYGSDLFILTIDGMVSLTAIMSASDQSPAIPVTDKVRGAFQESARSYAAGYGWLAMYYPRGRFVLVNVPQTTAVGGQVHQYVMNSQTRAWCRFRDQNAKSWALYNDAPYFGLNGGLVKQADAQLADGTAAIVARAKQAFNYFQTPGREKLWTMARPTIETEATAIVVQVALDTDFANSQLTPATSTIGSSGATWDVSAWDVTPWDSGSSISSAWATYGGFGRCAALQLNVSLNGASLKWYATDWVYQIGGIL